MPIPRITLLPPDATTMGDLMRRRCPDVLNYQSQMLPFLQGWPAYAKAFVEMLLHIPANVYGVSNFNSPSAEPDWCRGRLNLFDMKINRCLLGKNWSQ
jgi:hypothetical protein